MKHYLSILFIIGVKVTQNDAAYDFTNDFYNGGGGQRRQMMEMPMGTMLGAPGTIDQLPRSEPILPGHALIRPAIGMLKSSIKFPHKEFEDGAGVYGGPNSMGISFDQKDEKLSYSDFRRALSRLSPSFGIRDVENMPVRFYVTDDNNDRRNNLLVNNDHYTDLRMPTRRRKKPKPKKKKEKKIREDSVENPGNPFTVSHNRYLRNYLWNVVMTGDHMNINPLAPEFVEPMPGDLNGIRKWWYFHQDDFKPFYRRRR